LQSNFHKQKRHKAAILQSYFVFLLNQYIWLMEEFSGYAFSYWLLAFGTWLLTKSQ